MLKKRILFSSTGFTLIELISVIVIIGIISSVALSKLVESNAQARYALLKSVAGSLQTAASNINAKAIIAGKTGATGQLQMADGTTVDLVYGFPAASDNGIGKTLYVSGIPRLIILDAIAPPHWDLMVINEPYATNRCYAVYEEATATTPAKIFVMADIVPLASKGNSGSDQCQ